MSNWSSDSRRHAPMQRYSDDETGRDDMGWEDDMASAPTASRPSEGVSDAFMSRPGDDDSGPLDPLDRRFGGLDPSVVGEKVVFRLWADGLVSGRAIEQARASGDKRLRLDQKLVRLHLVDEDEAAHALAQELDAPEAQEADFPESPILVDELPRRFVEEALALPLAEDDAVLTLAMADPIDDYAQRAIAMKTRRRLEVLIASPRRIRAEIARLYDGAPARRARLQAAERAVEPAPTPRPAPRRAEPAYGYDEEELAPVNRFAAPQPMAREALFEARRAEAVEPAEERRLDPAGDLAERLAAPRFMRPKRVTRKNRTQPAARRAVEAEAAPREKRRFVSGIVDSIVAADPDMNDFDRDWMVDVDEPRFEDAPRRPAPAAAAGRPAAPKRPARAPQKRERAPVDDGARRTALAEVRRSLRAQAAVADHGPVPASALPQSPAHAPSPAYPQTRVYQAARALAERESTPRNSLAPDSVLRHKLIDAPIGDGRIGLGAMGGEISMKRDGGARAVRVGEVASSDVSPEALAKLRAVAEAGDGLALVAGPAGSAKLATLRDLAREAADSEAEIYRLDRAEDRARMAQARGRKIAYGEIRDAETAEAAVRLAMTGGLVFAAIDAASATAAPERLIRLGLPAYALASSLKVVATQTLVEKDCSRCAQTGRSVGGEVCPECSGQGAERRPALTEAMALDDSIRALILAHAPEAALRHAMETPPAAPTPRRPRRDSRAAQRIANAAMAGAYGFGAP